MTILNLGGGWRRRCKLLSPLSFSNITPAWLSPLKRFERFLLTSDPDTNTYKVPWFEVFPVRVFSDLKWILRFPLKITAFRPKSVWTSKISNFWYFSRSVLLRGWPWQSQSNPLWIKFAATQPSKTKNDNVKKLSTARS